MAENPTDISMPIVFVDGHDVELFDSFRDVALAFEPWMVEKTDWGFYDSQGRLLRLQTNGEQVFVTADEADRRNPQALRVALREHLEYTGRLEPGLPDLSLEKLLRLCIDAGLLWRPPFRSE